ncbi:hypothetical protein FRB91_010238 [Serendipita sp. 411]|nr:hypothetical protein FRC18_001060 [Serendipita sp. 400]KAG8858160.1 hypothetical protein FRB91_010238 [Serendipita sp. 411]
MDSSRHSMLHLQIALKKATCKEAAGNRGAREDEKRTDRAPSVRTVSVDQSIPAAGDHVQTAAGPDEKATINNGITGKVR